LQLTTQETGSLIGNGFSISYSTQKELLFKQQENAKFFIEGAGGGLTIAPNGNIGVGIANPTVALDVLGIVRAHEMKVCLNQGCDYVFADDYKLMNLTDLNNFIKANKHLPDVAPAAEMEAEGINLSEMNMLLLRKIEEFTLYIIGQEEQMQNMQKRLSELENKKGGE
jgi:hypothetical protein